MYRVPAPSSIPGKTSHCCFFPGHVDRHPSAYTRFYENGFCYTRCSACLGTMRGRYEISGGYAIIYEVSPENTKRNPFLSRGKGKRQFSPIPSKQQSPPLPNNAEASVATGFLIDAVLADIRQWPDKNRTPSPFWDRVLSAWRVNTSAIHRIENPPIFHELAVVFPLHHVDGNMLTPKGYWILSLGVRVAVPNQRGLVYIPCPNKFRNSNAVYLVGEPIDALRLAYLGVVAISGDQEAADALRSIGIIPLYFNLPSGAPIASLPDSYLQKILRRTQ